LLLRPLRVQRVPAWGGSM